MDKIIVKRGFDYEKIYYKAGVQVSEDIAKLFPEHVKVLSMPDEDVVEEVIEPVKEEVVEEQPKKKKSKKSKK